MQPGIYFLSGIDYWCLISSRGAKFSTEHSVIVLLHSIATRFSHSGTPMLGKGSEVVKLIPNARLSAHEPT